MNSRATVFFLGICAAAILVGCGDSTAGTTPDAGTADGSVRTDGTTTNPEAGVEPDAEIPENCGFDYDESFTYDVVPPPNPVLPSPGTRDLPGPDEIAHLEPPPDRTYRLSSVASGSHKDPGDIVMPDYNDTMPLFPRGTDWTTERRCYETPVGVKLLTQPEAFQLYRDIAELTTGVPMNVTPGQRTVVGVRGAYPGRFLWHGNLPDRFNDTLVLLWMDPDDPNQPERVREFHANTDTGAYDFGYHSSSSLRPNRRYHYINGWHNTYNAWHIDEASYLVWDDANKNGHWDSDRNGWFPPLTDDDHERTGSGHNIHAGEVNAPLGSATVYVRSAGCQVIPGMLNWTEFIIHAWTNLDDRVDYFLTDVRDIDNRVWVPCQPNGTHDCPYPIEAFPFTHSADTSTVTEQQFDYYNCADTIDERGPEVVYFFTVDRHGTVNISVDDVDGDDVDMDIHLLDADDPDACLNRANISFSHDLGPGRYYVIVDTYVENGQPLAGPYTLTVDFQ